MSPMMHMLPNLLQRHSKKEARGAVQDGMENVTSPQKAAGTNICSYYVIILIDVTNFFVEYYQGQCTESCLFRLIVRQHTIQTLINKGLEKILFCNFYLKKVKTVVLIYIKFCRYLVELKCFNHSHVWSIHEKYSIKSNYYRQKHYNLILAISSSGSQ